MTSRRATDEETTPAELLEWLRDSGCAVLDGKELKLWNHLRPHREELRTSGPGCRGRGRTAEAGPAPDEVEGRLTRRPASA